MTNIAHTTSKSEIKAGNCLGSQESGNTQSLKLSDFGLEFANLIKDHLKDVLFFRYRSEMTSSVFFPIRLSSDPKTEIPENSIFFQLSD